MSFSDDLPQLGLYIILQYTSVISVDSFEPGGGATQVHVNMYDLGRDVPLRFEK